MSRSDPLRVTHLSTTDLKGGAALCAYRLNGALAGAGVRSQLLVAQRFGRNDGTMEFNPLAPAPRALGRMFFRIGRRFHRPSVEKAGAYFSQDWTLTSRGLVSRLPPTDVANLHWVSDFVDYRLLPELAERVPMVWTFHDMNVFTGGCHYSGECERFAERCGSCPQLRTSCGPDDMTRRVIVRKRRIFEQISPSRLVAVCPSRWLAGAARRSAIFRAFDVRVIPTGIDLEEFHAVPRREARERFGLSPEAKVVLFVADFVNDPRKGLAHLFAAIDSIRETPGLQVITIGRGESGVLAGPVRHLGPLSGGEALSAAYSAADVFIIPSLQDNFPNTVLESMACGTPVVGFASGGIAESVRPGSTGLLAPTGDAVALGRMVRRVLEDGVLRRALASESRAVAEREYSIGLQAERYARLYREMVEGGMECAAAGAGREGFAQ